MTRRFEQASMLRAYAKRVRQLRFRSAEAYLEAMDDLASDLERDASAIVRLDEPRAETVFSAFRSGGFRAERR